MNHGLSDPQSQALPAELSVIDVVLYFFRINMDLFVLYIVTSYFKTEHRNLIGNHREQLVPF